MLRNNRNKMVGPDPYGWNQVITEVIDLAGESLSSSELFTRTASILHRHGVLFTITAYKVSKDGALVASFGRVDPPEEYLSQIMSLIDANANSSHLLGGPAPPKLDNLLGSHHYNFLSLLGGPKNDAPKVLFLIHLVDTKTFTETSKNQLNRVLRVLWLQLQASVLAEENKLLQKVRNKKQEGLPITAKPDSDLAKRNQKLKELDESKDEFISMASHQLRTPLTSIKGYLSMVIEGDAGELNDAQKQMLSQALFSAQRMVYLISDLLNVSRLQTGKFVVEKAEVDLYSLVSEEVEQLQEGAKVKNIKLSFKGHKRTPKMNLDDMKIRQIVMNFVDNAIYYTPDGGRISVSLENKPNAIEFRVMDNGIGVPKAQQHKLFGKFFRADNARKNRPDGTGLGLYMAKKLIIVHGGSLIFSSKEGQGSTFGFTLPKPKK